MRVSKAPEVRRQELLDTAMAVFAEKGYETTTMRDIARAAGVAAGLCYHYFQNKETLYRAAVEQYAARCAAPFLAVFRRTDLPLPQAMEQAEAAWRETLEAYPYRDYFHRSGNEIFHQQLNFYLIQELLPALTAYLSRRKELGEIQIGDPGAAALFLLHGQTALAEAPELTPEQRLQECKLLVGKILQ